MKHSLLHVAQMRASAVLAAMETSGRTSVMRGFGGDNDGAHIGVDQRNTPAKSVLLKQAGLLFAIADRC